MMFVPFSLELFNQDMSQKVTPWPQLQRRPTLQQEPSTGFSPEQLRRFRSIWQTVSV